MCSSCVCTLTVLRLCRATDHTHMNYHQAVIPQSMCTCVNCDEDVDDVCVCARVFMEKFKRRCNRNNRGSLFPLFVSIDCAAERSCPQSGAPSPSQSTSSHTLSSAKSKGSLRRQSKSVVWSLLCISTCCTLTSHA